MTELFQGFLFAGLVIIIAVIAWEEWRD